MRRLLVLLALFLAAPAAAATIEGTTHGDVLVGTQAPDTIVAGVGNDAIQAAWGGIDTVDCGRGIDIVSADLTDKVAPNCEIVSRRLSVDSSSNPSGQHETAVEPDAVASGSTVLAAFQVGRFQSGGSSNIGFALSRDAGRTWRRGLLPSLTVESSPGGTERAASDPSVAYDAAHGVWLIATLTLEQNASHVMVSRSADGMHWSAPAVAATGALLDKEWIACDNGPSSPFHGRCYVLYADDQKNVTTSQSSDDGGVTWSQPVTATRVLVGTQPVALADGTLVTLAGDYHGSMGLTGTIEGFRSADGGATFSTFTVSDIQSARPGQMRAIPLPSLQVDAAGTLDVAWDDCRFRTACAENDIVLSSSHDEGLTWSAPQRVPIVPVSSTQSSFIPALAADPSRAGGLAIVYAYFLPGSCDRGSCLLGIGLVQSRDGGASWTAPQQLDAEPMTMDRLAQAEGGRMVGDYFSAAFSGGRVVPVFTLAASPLNGRLREAIFASSLRALG
jgi:hypothetical protein